MKRLRRLPTMLAMVVLISGGLCSGVVAQDSCDLSGTWNPRSEAKAPLIIKERRKIEIFDNSWVYRVNFGALVANGVLTQLGGGAVMHAGGDFGSRTIAYLRYDKECRQLEGTMWLYQVDKLKRTFAGKWVRG